MQEFFKATIGITFLLSQIPVAAMQPITKKALALGASAATVAITKHFTRAHAAAKITTMPQPYLSAGFLKNMTTLKIAGAIGLGGVIAYSGYQWYLKREARNFCLYCLQQAKAAIIKGDLNDANLHPLTWHINIVLLLSDAASDAKGSINGENNCWEALDRVENIHNLNEKHLIHSIRAIARSIKRHNIKFPEAFEWTINTKPDQATIDSIIAFYDTLIQLIS